MTRLSPRPVLYLYTDFGAGSLYVGQLHGILATHRPQVRVIDLCHELEPCDARHAAYLLDALSPYLVRPALVVGVIDPGVGTTRAPILVQGDGISLVGPDNGLFALIAHQMPVRIFELGTRGVRMLSASFHGRDLFVPWALRLCTEPRSRLAADLTPLTRPLVGSDWPLEIQEVIHIDRFGNALTGCVGSVARHHQRLKIGSQLLAYRTTFGEAAPGSPFWYVNSLNRVEIACNRQSAQDALGVQVGDAFEWV